MSKAFPPRPRALSGKSDFSYAIVASKFNETYVKAMVDRAHAEINALDPEAQVVLVWTPGSFEIPLFVQSVAELKRFNAILAMGVILQGETAHAKLIAESVTKALLDISLKHRVPVIHEVLFLANEDQAKERCLGDKHNRGVEAARAAVFASRKLPDIA
jgi:6,7-dimethyl-8-ribityllumazine synthase